MAKAQKYRDVSKFLRSQGWEFKRQTGSHERWEHESGAKLTIAAHGGEVSSGQVAQLIKAIPNTPKNWK